jgi:hypothetical protein
MRRFQTLNTERGAIMSRIRNWSAIVVVSVSAAVAGCGSGGTDITTAAKTTTTDAAGGTSTPTTTTTQTTAASTANYHPKIDPSAFTSKVTNEYLPFRVGDHRVFKGTRDGAPITSTFTVTDKTRTVMGVDCVVVKDVVTSNQSLVEKTTDWYAQDSKGNVWYFGENTAEYENGVVISTDGTWEAGVDHAQPGIVMETNPKVGDHYRQEFRPGVAEDTARVLDTNASIKTPAGPYDHLIITFDKNPLDPSKKERKWYAAGIGFVHAELHGGGHTETIGFVK